MFPTSTSLHYFKAFKMYVCMWPPVLWVWKTWYQAPKRKSYQTSKRKYLCQICTGKTFPPTQEARSLVGNALTVIVQIKQYSVLRLWCCRPQQREFGYSLFRGTWTKVVLPYHKLGSLTGWGLALRSPHPLYNFFIYLLEHRI